MVCFCGSYTHSWLSFLVGTRIYWHIIYATETTGEEQNAALWNLPMKQKEAWVSFNWHVLCKVQKQLQCM